VRWWAAVREREGRPPADSFELVLNRKAAKEIGLPIPASLLARADRVID